MLLIVCGKSVELIRGHIMLGARDRAMICNPEHESLAINKVVETYMDAENVYIDDLFTSSNIYPYM